MTDEQGRSRLHPAPHSMPLTPPQLNISCSVKALLELLRKGSDSHSASMSDCWGSDSGGYSWPDLP